MANMSIRNIKCLNCGIYNVNRDYCSNCNAVLSYKKRRELAYKKEEEARLERRRLEKENNPSFYARYKDHRFFLVRAFVKLLRSIWVVVMSIGMFIAWIITTIAA